MLTPSRRFRNLGEDEVNRIRQVIEDEGNVEGDLRQGTSRCGQAPDRHSELSRHAPPAGSSGQRPAHPPTPALAKARARAPSTTTVKPNGRDREQKHTSKQDKKFKKREREKYAFLALRTCRPRSTPSSPSTPGDALAASGWLGFRGSRKGTPFAAQQAASNTTSMARDHGLRAVRCAFSGPGSGRESAIRALAAAHMKVRTIRDVTHASQRLSSANACLETRQGRRD